MAIIQCPECGWYISDKSLFCVRCGCCFIDFNELGKALSANLEKEVKASEEVNKKTNIYTGKHKNISVEVDKAQEEQPDDNEKVIYTVHEIKDILGIGISQAYELVKTNQFPVKHIGKKIVIPIKPFNEWLHKSNDIKKE